MRRQTRFCFQFEFYQEIRQRKKSFTFQNNFGSSRFDHLFLVTCRKWRFFQPFRPLCSRSLICLNLPMVKFWPHYWNHRGWTATLTKLFMKQFTDVQWLCWVFWKQSNFWKGSEKAQNESSGRNPSDTFNRQQYNVFCRNETHLQLTMNDSFKNPMTLVPSYQQ